MSLMIGRLEVSVALTMGVQCSVGLVSRPSGMRVSRLMSLGKVDDTHELFYLADGDVFLLFDGKTFSVKKHV